MREDLERRIQDAISESLQIVEQTDLADRDEAVLEEAALAAEQARALLERLAAT